MYLLKGFSKDRMLQKVYFWAEYTVLKSEISFFLTGCLTEIKELYLSSGLPITERTDGFLLFPWKWLNEVQSASFRIWTRVTDSLSFDNRYTPSDSVEGRTMYSF